MKELTLQAALPNLAGVTGFIDRQLEELACPLKIQMQIDVAVDEIFSNIAQYAYPDGTGDVTVRFDYRSNENTAMMEFIDSGIPYDPLAQAEPDVTLPADQRAVGGLGIFLVKKTMDEVCYERRDGRNCFKIFKKLVKN